MARFPEYRVTRSGAMVERVEWVPRDGEPVLDITHMHVAAVESVITPNDLPAVKVTFLARLVEVESDG